MNIPLVPCKCGRCCILMKGDTDHDSSRPNCETAPSFGLDGWIEERPYAAVVVGHELQRVCSWCFSINGLLHERTDVKLLRCSGCRIRFYCDSRCQRADWSDGHRVECQCYRECLLGMPIVQCQIIARLVGRILIRQKLMDTPETEFYGKPVVTLKELGKKAKTFPSRSRYMNEYKTFLAGFTTLFGQNGEKLKINKISSGSNNTSDNLKKSFFGDLQSVERIYDIVRQFAFPIVSFDPGCLGNRKLGLGLYLNFTRFAHSCSPSLLSIFEPSDGGPALKAQRQIGTGVEDYNFSLQFDEHTISRFEFVSMIEEFGTLFPFQEEIDAYLEDEWLIARCGCVDCEVGKCINARNRLLMLNYSIDLPCPKCGEGGKVIAGVCNCSFNNGDIEEQFTKARKQVKAERLKTKLRWPTVDGERNMDCPVCAESLIAPSERARCLSCGIIFRHKPEFPYDIGGPPALVQLVQRCEAFGRQADVDNLFDFIDTRYNLTPIRQLESKHVPNISVAFRTSTMRDGNKSQFGYYSSDSLRFFGLLFMYLGQPYRRCFNFSYLTLMFEFEKLYRVHQLLPVQFRQPQLPLLLEEFEDCLRLPEWQLYFVRYLLGRYRTKQIARNLILTLTNRVMINGKD